MANYRLVGKKIVYIGQETFDPDLVSDEAATITLTPSTTEISSQDGTIQVPNGAYDEISASITLIIDSIETLMKIFPGLSKKATYAGATGGQVTFGGGECMSTEPVPVVIHNFCDEGSDQDIYIPKAIIQAGGEFTVSLGDPFTLEVNITPTKSTEGYVRFGEGKLDAKSHYNPDTQSYENLA